MRAQTRATSISSSGPPVRGHEPVNFRGNHRTTNLAIKRMLKPEAMTAIYKPKAEEPAPALAEVA